MEHGGIDIGAVISRNFPGRGNLPRCETLCSDKGEVVRLLVFAQARAAHVKMIHVIRRDQPVKESSKDNCDSR